MTLITKDARSQKLVVCCHCVLNQNSKLEGIAGWQGAITEVVNAILESGAGIIQMPCPELLYEGIGRFDKSYEQYDFPVFRSICKNISQSTVEQISNYQQWGYQISAIVAIDGSPSCGFNLTQSAPEWRGLVAEQQWKKVRYIEKKGILFEELTPYLEKLDTLVPIIGIPEIPQLGNLKTALDHLKEKLK